MGASEALMENLTNWLRGPLFWAVLAWALLGLGRHVLVTLWEVRRIVHQAGDPRVAYGRVLRSTLRLALPRRTCDSAWLFSGTSVVSWQ
jgi:hypothetical protein